MAHIQPRIYVLDHEDYTAPTRQHGLDHMDQESISISVKNLDGEVRIGDLSDAWDNALL